MGNADIRSYDFSVLRGDWATGTHWGDGVILRSFTIPDSLTPGTDLRSVFDDGGVVQVYVTPDEWPHFGQWKQVPYLYQRELAGARYGISIEYIPTREALVIAKTANGWDRQGITDEELPQAIQVKIVVAPKPSPW